MSCEVTRGAQHENTPGRGCSWHAEQIFVTDSTVANFSVAESLVAKFKAEYLLADRGYDTDAIVQKTLQAEMAPVIPPKKNRQVLREYDKHIYKRQHLIENAFLGIAKLSYIEQIPYA